MTVAANTLIDVPWTHVDDMFIGGRWVPAHTQTRTEVVDPATEQVWGSVPDADAVDVDAAVVAARGALAGWAALRPSQRAEYLRAIAREVRQRAQPLALTNTRENGSPIAETGGAASNAASIFEYFATLSDYLEAEDLRVAPVGGHTTVVERDPIGVCALIAPWNFPINLVVIKLAPALLAGCTVVIKPATPTPLSIRFIVEAVSAAGVPDGVVNLITGDAAAGDMLVRHPGIDKVAFTGSTPVGRKIAAACGELLKPVTLELGGKSSAVVLPDADLDQMAGVLIRSCLRNTGQTCYISTRILAPESRYDEVVDMVAATVGSATLGDPLDPDTVFGPVANRMQYEKVLAYLRGAVTEGARVVVGGGPVPEVPGFYVQPTVLADVTPEMTVAREEIFGPVITILRYGSIDEAVDLANNTDFGLGGVVFGRDEEQALAVARRIDSGSVGINFFASNHSAPFGGRHDSGLGVEYGIEGLHAYLTYKSIHRR